MSGFNRRDSATVGLKPVRCGDRRQSVRHDDCTAELLGGVSYVAGKGRSLPEVEVEVVGYR